MSSIMVLPNDKGTRAPKSLHEVFRIVGAIWTQCVKYMEQPFPPVTELLLALRGGDKKKTPYTLSGQYATAPTNFLSGANIMGLFPPKSEKLVQDNCIDLVPRCQLITMSCVGFLTI